MTIEQQIADLTTANTKLTDQVLQTKSKAEVSATAAKKDANRAVAERQKITTELSQVQALAAQVSADKLLVESTKIGDEDYVVPAVVQLLAGYTDVVDVAISDAVWAEHAYKWGAPAQVLAVAESDRVVLHDMTCPSFPVFDELPCGGTGGAAAGNMLSANGVAGSITSVEFVGDCLVVGKSETTGDWYSGIFLVSFARDECLRWKRASVQRYRGGIAQAADDLGFDVLQTGGIGTANLADDQHINDVAARIADDAPKHPVSGLPMPTIAAATDGGVSVLNPDDQGGWSVANITGQASGVVAVDINERMEIVATYSYKDSVAVYDCPSTDITNDQHSRRYYPNTNRNGSYPYLVGGSLKGFVGDLLYSPEGLTIQKQNPTSSVDGMAAYLSENYSTPFMPGDVQSAILCDGEAGVIVGGEIDVAGFTARNIVRTAGQSEQGHTESTTYKAGDLFRVDFEAVSNDGAGTGDLYVPNTTAQYERVFTPAAVSGGDTTAVARKAILRAKVDNPSISLRIGGGENKTGDFTVNSLKAHLLAEDYSGRNNHAKIHGTLNRTKPAGSDIAVWSGFAADQNYITQSVPDIGVGEFSLTGYVDIGLAGYRGIFDWTPDVRSILRVSTSHSAIVFKCGNGVGYPQEISYTLPNPTGEYVYTIGRDEDNNLIATVNGIEVGRIANFTASMSHAVLEAVIGLYRQSGGLVAGGSQKIAFTEISKTYPSPDQIRDIHRDMLNKLTKPSMLTGTVKAVAHDAVRSDDWVACSDSKLHRLTPRGTTFEQTIDVPAGVGGITSLTVDDGVITVGGSTGVWVNQPEKNLRAPVVKSAKSVQPFELGEGDSVKTDFYLPPGWKPVRAYVNGAKKRKGAQDDWQPLFDGYRWFIRFAVAPGVFDIDADAVEV